MIGAIITILGGILAAASFFIARMPNAKELIDKITPYQGWIGITLFLWGVWETINVVLNIGWISSALIFWIVWVVVALSDLFVGFLLGFGLITKYALSKNEQALEKGQKIRLRLIKFQVPLGFISIAVGVLFLFCSLGLFMFGYIGAGVVIVGYVVLLIVMGSPKPNASEVQSSSTPATNNKKQNASPAVASKNGPFYEIRISNVSCVPEGTSYKIGMRITAKKFVIDSASKAEKEVMINNDIQIGMMKDGKEIYLKGYAFTKTVTSLSLLLAQKPDKVGIDPYNLLPEKASVLN